ncbi:MAG: diguanylate cyclase [Methylococcaceae bacterium]|nr:diguanylate cyclase [Methylococcaceae bacterium]
MNRLSFSKKFTLLGTIALISVSIALFSLYIHMSETIGSSQKELQGLTFISPLIKNIQMLQQHRGLSSAVLSGINELDGIRTTKERIVTKTFHEIEIRLMTDETNVRQLESWKDIIGEWADIQVNGMQWSQSENFTAQTRLINKMLLLESIISDDYGLTVDPNLDSFYLAYVVKNDLLATIERLGQIRAYGTAILGAKKINEQQRSDIVALVTLLRHSIVPFKVNIDKAAYYNPHLYQILSESYGNIETSAQQVIDEVDTDILNARFSISPSEFFAFTTNAIDSGYTQLHESFLSAAENLIQARIHQAESALHITIIFACLLLFMVAYFMMAIHRTTLSSIQVLTQSVLGFVHGDMQERVHLNTYDELSTIGDGFNSMADELAELIAEKQNTLDLLSKIARSVPGVVYQFRQDVNGGYCFPFASEGLRDIYHISPAEVRDDAAKVFLTIYPVDLDKFKASIRVSAQNLTLWHHEYRVQFDDGTVKWLLGNAMPERETDGSTLWHGFITDITERKAAERKLRMLSTAIEQSPTSVVITNLGAKIEYMNSRFTQVTGYSVDEVIGKNPRVLQSGLTDKSVYGDMWNTLTQGQPWVGEFINKRKNGDIYYEEAYISPVQEDGGVTSHYVAVKLDVTQRKKLEEEVRQLAFYDALTKLANRRLLADRLSHAMTASKRSNAYGALMFLDLDNFKPLNDRHGHGVGDMLLMEAAQRLTRCIREIDTVARFGGDEFVVMLAELYEDKALSAIQASIVAEKIRTALSVPYVFTLADTTVEHYCTVSIGVAMFIDHESHQNDIMKWADAAMYEAKEAGRNQIRFYEA